MIFYNTFILSLFLTVYYIFSETQCYFEAWSYAKRQMDVSTSDNSNNNSPPEKQALKDFIKNWTSLEFGEYVKQLENLVNKMDSATVPAWGEIEEYWKTMVDLEVKFWPSGRSEDALPK